MKRKAGSKINLLFLHIAVMLMLSVGVVMAAHTSSGTLEPEWSPANALVDYIVDITNEIDGGDPIDEVRVIKNPDYTTFNCEPIPGWELIYVPSWFEEDVGGLTEMCWYFTLDPDENIEETFSQEFEFSATSPAAGNCELPWKFETRDQASNTSGDWNSIFVSTSVDDLPPVITKNVIGTQLGQCPPAPNSNDECWITQDTLIEIWVEDQSLCPVPSGLVECTVSVKIDGVDAPQYNEVLNPIEGEIHYELDFDENSQHELTVECKDLAGNTVTDVELFKVDSEPPITEKHFEGPQKIVQPQNHEQACDPKIESCIEWIDGVTTIVLTPEDPNPIHASGLDETLWRLSGAPDEVCFSTARCDEFNGQGEWNDYIVPIGDIEESCHVLEYWSIDNIGNEETKQNNCFFVDRTPPIVRKVHDDGEDDHFIEDVDLLPPIEGEFHWTTPDSEIKFYCIDEGDHPSYGEKLWFRVSYELDLIDGYITDEYCDDFLDGELVDYQGGTWCVVPNDNPDEGFTFNFHENEDSIHDLEYFCEDAVEKKGEIHKQWYKVDSTAPTIDDDMFGTDHLGYRNEVPNSDACPPKQEGDVCYVRDSSENGLSVWVHDGGPICHVDRVICEYLVWWQTSDDECFDADGEEYIEGECLIDFGSFEDEHYDIVFTEDSTHRIELKCSDGLWNTETYENTFLVDSTPPETIKHYGEPQKVEPWCWEEALSQCEGNLDCAEQYAHDNCVWWITSDTPITLEAEDNKVGVEITEYRVSVPLADRFCDPNACDEWMESIRPDMGPFNLYIDPFKIDQESCHVIEYRSTDLLHNEEEIKWQCVFVDNTAPLSVKEVGEPRVPGIVDEFDWYVTQETPIWLECKDQEPHPVEQETLCYRVSLHGDDLSNPADYSETENYCNEFGGEFDVDTGYCCQYVGEDGHDLQVELLNNHEEHGVHLNFQEDSFHDLEYFCKDHLGNTEDPTHIQFYAVDTVPPVITKTVIGPQWGTCPPEPRNGEHQSLNGDNGEYNENDHCYVNGATEIHVDVVDPEPHPVDDVACEYYIYWETDPETCEDYNYTWDSDYGACLVDDDEFGDNTVIQFTEDSTHVLKLHCWDSLHNSVWDVEEFKVDHKPPTVGKEISDPYHDEWYVHPWCVMDAEEWCEVNWEDENYINHEECVNDYVRNTCGDEDHQTWSEWINSDTKIWPFADDKKSGVAGLWYRVTLVDDEYCRYGNHVHEALECKNATGNDNLGGWQYVYGVDPDELPQEDYFQIGEESCHLVEIRAIDRVEKEDTHKQCIFVDNTGPDPIKTVGAPHDLWTPGKNGDPLSTFYTEETAHCWDGTEDSIDCWEVTILTPITLDCSDPGTHPVNHEKVCFNVDFDNQDITEDYCENADGDMTDEGYCCILEESAPIEFHFTEESEHNLKYYCEDALGNRGPLDDEKFKVEGTAFEININKKWNLISTPVKLLDDSMGEVFGVDNDEIESVWQYDAENDVWYSYTPDGEDNDDLTSMEPGWGYFVLAHEDTQLLIGGSLISPAMVPPSVKIVENSWNLIGYYGTEGLSGYYGPYGDGKKAGCALYSLGDSHFDKGWSTLYGYWEPYNPNQWSYLWDDVDEQDYQSRYGYSDFLDPGAGYWLYSLEDGNYVHTSNCELFI